MKKTQTILHKTAEKHSLLENEYFRCNNKVEYKLSAVHPYYIWEYIKKSLTFELLIYSIKSMIQSLLTSEVWDKGSKMDKSLFTFSASVTHMYTTHAWGMKKDYADIFLSA